jgi:hypothetical protein
MKSRYLLGLIAVLGLAYICHYWWDAERVAKERQAARDARRQAQYESIIEMAKKANAITDWLESLASEKGLRASPIMTYELQRLWLVDRPVLFIGKIIDIVRNHDGTYQINVRQEKFGGPIIILHNEIRLILTCQESLAVKMTNSVRANKFSRPWADFAVIATIEKIERSIEKGDDESSVTVQSGIGRCVDALELTEFLPKQMFR